MSKKVITIGPKTTIKEAILEMSSKKIRRLIVAEGGHIRGVICHRDVVRALPSSSGEDSGEAGTLSLAASVGDIMKKRVIGIDQDKPIEDAARLMTKYHIGGLPVTSHGRLSGIINESDIFRAFTALLTGKGSGGVRITFDVTGSETILQFLYESCRRLSLKLASFVNFEDEDRKFVVARIRGDNVQELVDSIWDSGHVVVNVLKDSD